MRFSYALNQWNSGHDRFVLREDHARAFKTVAACGFDAVEISCGSGRWEPLGRKDWIERYYGSVSGLGAALAECGIRAVSSYIFNPAEPIFEEGAFGLSVLSPGDHPRIQRTLTQYGDILSALGGDTVVVRALPNWSESVSVTAATMSIAADCWNAVGKMLAGVDVRLALNFDCLTMARTAQDIALLLDHCDPAYVGLSIDTADAAIMNLDPLELYAQFSPRVCHVQLKNTRHVDELDEYKMPFPEKFMLAGGGKRLIDRWYSELDDDLGLVDIRGFYRALLENDYKGWAVIESDQSPEPASSAMLNSWFVHRQLTNAAEV